MKDQTDPPSGQETSAVSDAELHKSVDALTDGLVEVRGELDRDRATMMSLLRSHATDIIELSGSLRTLRTATITFFAITAAALGITYVAQYPKRGEPDASCREELIQVRTPAYSGNEALRVQCPHPDQYLARAVEVFEAKQDLGVYACRCKKTQELVHQDTKLSILFNRMKQFDKAVEKSGELESAEKRMARMEAVRKVAEAVAVGDFQMSDGELEALGLKKPEDPPETKPRPISLRARHISHRPRHDLSVRLRRLLPHLHRVETTCRPRGTGGVTRTATT